MCSFLIFILWASCIFVPSPCLFVFLRLQAAKCHSRQGLRQWACERSGVAVQDSSAPRGAVEGGESAEDVTTLLAFDAETDAFCCSLTQPIWQFLTVWVKTQAQEPSLNRRLLHFVKAKENAQNFLQQSAGQHEPGVLNMASKEQAGASRETSTSSQQHVLQLRRLILYFSVATSMMSTNGCYDRVRAMRGARNQPLC